MAIAIKGLEKLSVIDYPGKTCSIVFLSGCSFRCPYCHNPDLITKPGKIPDVSEEDLMKFLESRKKWIDGVSISGGEPCLHNGLPDLARRIKEAGFAVKLDTNGSNPDMLGELIKEGLLNYIAMDIKAPLEKYSEVAKVDVDTGKIKRSTNLIMESGIDYEFRTTVVPSLFSKDDMEKIGEWLKGAKNYFVQGFKSGNTLDKTFGKEGSFSEEELEEIAEIARKYFKNVGVRS